MSEFTAEKCAIMFRIIENPKSKLKESKMALPKTIFNNLYAEYGKIRVDTVLEFYVNINIQKLESILGNWKDESFCILEGSGVKSWHLNCVNELGNYHDDKFKEENKMKGKYVTREKDYTGCDPEIAELLKQNLEVKGLVGGTNQHKVVLTDYLPQSSFPYRIRYKGSGNCDGAKNFTPTLAKKSTTDVRTLIENGVEIEVDTKVFTICENSKVKGHFAYSNQGILSMWKDGKTAFSSEGEACCYFDLYLLEPREYTPKEG